MRREIFRQVSIVACLAGLATATVLFVALWNGTQPPQWMLLLVAVVCGYEVAQWGGDLWFARSRR